MNINYSTIKKAIIAVGVIEMIIGVGILAKIYLGIASLMPFSVAIIVVAGLFIGHELLVMSIGYIKVVTNDALFKPTLLKYVNDGGDITIIDDDGTILGEEKHDEQ